MDITIFGASFCKYCNASKDLAKLYKQSNKKTHVKFISIKSFNEIESKSLTLFKKDLSKTNKTIPKIFVNKKYIGGFSQLYRKIKNKVDKNKLIEILLKYNINI